MCWIVGDWRERRTIAWPTCGAAECKAREAWAWLASPWPDRRASPADATGTWWLKFTRSDRLLYLSVYKFVEACNLHMLAAVLHWSPLRSPCRRTWASRHQADIVCIPYLYTCSMQRTYQTSGSGSVENNSDAGRLFFRKEIMNEMWRVELFLVNLYTYFSAFTYIFGMNVTIMLCCHGITLEPSLCHDP